MEFDPRDITFLFKDPNSNTGECHGVSKVPGGYLIQGDPVGPGTHAALRAKSQLGAGEAAVFVNDATVAKLIAEGTG